jgi:uncharacterized protein (DUF58 family)
VVVTTPLTPERVLRRLEWRVIRRLDGRLQGDYRTLFRGAGIDVADLREYQPGDDLRHIDWNVTARMDTPYVREYLEEREITAWLLIDRSASMGFGPVDRRKHLVSAEIAATLAQLLARGGNQIGAVLFDRRIERTIPPGHGRNQVLRILSHLLQDAPPQEPPAGGRRTDGGRRPDDDAPARRPWLRLRSSRPEPTPDPPRGTDLSLPLRATLGIARRRSLVVVVSDFLSEPGWEGPLGRLARRHDVLALQVVDRREFQLPAVGMIYVEDAETGEQIFVDTDDVGFRRRLEVEADARQAGFVSAVRSAGTDLFTITTDEDLVRALARISDLRRVRRS